MGGSSSKRTFIWQKKKKKSPVDNALSHLKGALPGKKRKKKSKVFLKKLHLDKLQRKKRSQKKFSLSAVKRLSVGHTRKGSTHSASPGRKEDDGGGGGGLGNIGEKMKKKFSLPL